MEFSRKELKKSRIGVNNYRLKVRKGKLAVGDKEEKLKELRELSNKWQELLIGAEEGATWEMTKK